MIPFLCDQISYGRVNIPYTTMRYEAPTHSHTMRVIAAATAAADTLIHTLISFMCRNVLDSDVILCIFCFRLLLIYFTRLGSRSLCEHLHSTIHLYVASSTLSHLSTDNIYVLYFFAVCFGYMSSIHNTSADCEMNYYHSVIY